MSAIGQWKPALWSCDFSWNRSLAEGDAAILQYTIARQSREVAEVPKMAVMIWAGILAICLLAAWFVLRRPLRQIVEDVHVDHAREQFHQQREWLEARFVSALGRDDPSEGQRWDSAHWHDEILWARDRQSRHLLALVCVHFEPGPFDLLSPARHATAVFEFRKARWCADGKRLDEMRPNEAVGRNQRFEAVAVTPLNTRKVS
jgi:hypothetical protein